MKYFLPLLIFAIAGCDSPEDKAQPVDFGSEYSAAQITTVRSNAVKGLDPMTIQAGQFVHWADLQIVNGSETPSFIDEVGETVVSRTEDADQVTLDIKETRLTYNSDQTTSTANRDITGVITKNPAPAPAPTPAVPSALPSAFPQSLTLARAIEWAQSAPERIFTSGLHAYADDPITYHNLIDNVVDLAPPPLVQARPNCGGLPNCRIHAHNISYDVVQWVDGAPNKIHVDETISASVPFLASILNPYPESEINRCITLLVSLDNTQQKALVTQCAEVVDFAFTINGQ